MSAASRRLSHTLDQIAFSQVLSDSGGDWALEVAVELANLVPTVASSHKDGGKLGQHDSFSDGNGHLLGELNTKNNMSFVVPNSDKKP